MGYLPKELSNPSLGWERTEEYNIGFDFGFFRNRQLMTIFHILKFILYDCRYFHPLHRFLSDRTPGCFHNIP